MKKLAILVCLAMLISVFAVCVSAEGTTTITSTVDFRAVSEFAGVQLENSDPAASKAAMESLGLVIPDRIGWFEDAGEDANHAWKLQDCFHVFATPADGFQNCAYIQKLEAPEGKTLTADATLDIGYWLALGNPDWEPSYVVVEVSTDGENWTEVAADEEANGAEFTADAYAEVRGLPLSGTAGASVVYVKIVVNRHGGQTAGGVAFSAINGTVEGEGEPEPEPVDPSLVSSAVDFRAVSEFAGVQLENSDPAASKAAMEALGLVIPDRIGWFEDAGEDANHAWKLQDCFHVFATPADGFQNCAYIQKLEIPEGKVLAADATLDIGYWLALGNPDWEPSYVVVEVSTDGENWTEVAADEEANGAEFTADAYAEVRGLPLTGTAGASAVYVKIVVNRHGGQTAGGVAFSAINGNTTDAGAGDGPVGGGDEAPETVDLIGVAVVLLAASGMGITVLKKKN